MSLSEDISGLIDGSDREKTNSTTGNMLANEMTINLNMFGAIMKNIIVSNLNGTLIVTIERGRIRRRNTHISKEPAKPEKFLSSISKSSVFSFGARAGSEGLFFATPSKKRVP
ncbi:hypothetical protein CsSME_00050391 [Camellia sinensis var. sinensis]